MKWLKSLYEVREARAKALKAEEDLGTARVFHTKAEREWANMQREEKIAEYYKGIQELEMKLKAKTTGIVWLTSVMPGEGEDPELVQEAWERYQREREKLG